MQKNAVQKLWIMSIWSGIGIKSDLHNMQINRYSTCSMGIGMGISILHFLLPSFKNWVSSCLYSNFFILGVLFGLLTHPHPVCSMACHDIWFHMTLNVLTSLYVLNFSPVVLWNMLCPPRVPQYAEATG